MDIVASNRTMASSGFTARFSVDLFLGKGGGVFLAPTHLTFTESGAGTCNCTHPLTATDGTPNMHSIVAGDFNGDGHPDIAFLDNDGSSFSNTWIVVALATVDGSHNVTFALNSQKGIHGNISQPRSLVTGDINGDGTPDLVFNSYSGTTLAFALIGKGDGTFPQMGNGTSLGSGRDLLVADLDGDGRLDMIGTNTFFNTFNSVYMGSKVATSIAFNGVPVSSASSTSENILAQGLVTLDPNLANFHGIGFHFVPSTAAQVTIKNGASTIGSATPTFTAPAVNTTISNVLAGGVSAVASVGANNFVAQFPGDARMFAPPTDSPIVHPTNFSFTTQPSNTQPNATIVGPPVVQASGIGSQSSPAAITIGLDHGSFVSGSTTSGTVNNFNTFSVVFNNLKIATVGQYFLFAMAGNDLLKSNQFSITGGATSQLVYTVGLPINTTAGVQQSVTVQAQDNLGNQANNYTGGVHFTSTDGNAVLPADYTFVAGDNSTRTFQVTLKTAGSRGVTVTDKVNSSLTATTNTTVGAAGVAAVTLNTPAAVQINQTFGNLTAHVVDAYNNPVNNASVAFALTPGGSGSTGTFAGNINTTTTNAGGDATSAALTANNKAGTFNVTATQGLISSAASTLTISTGPVTTIAVTQGSNQSTTVNSQFNLAFNVLATDAGSNPVSAYSVTFTSPSSGASCGYPSAASTSANTDNSGTASITCTANSTTGSYSVTASGSGVASVNIVNLTNSPAAASNINIVAGNNQSATVNTNFTNPMQVKVVDAGNNGIGGLFLQFSAPGSGAAGTFQGAGSTAFVGPTAADGTATAPAFTANTIAGSYQVSVTITVGGSPSLADARRAGVRGRTGPASASSTPMAGPVAATFNLTNTAGAPKTMTIVSGNNQSATVGAAFANPLVVNVVDNFSNPVPNAAVTFTPPGSGASGNSSPANPVSTNPSGNASVTFTANNTVGANYSVAVSCTGTAGVNFTLSNTAGASSIMTIVGGNGQHATIGNPFSTALQVKITDGLLNPLSGISVTFTPPASGASGAFSVSDTVTTNASGIATAPTYTANSVAGANGLKAVAGALNQTFNLTNDPGPAANLALSGTPQNGIVNQAYGTPLSVTITDAFGNGVPSQPVTLTAPSSGASGSFGGSATFSGTTNSSGLLTASTFTANGSTGAFQVTATSGALTAKFNLTNIVIPTAGIAVFSGSGQGTAPTAAFSSPLVARVFDTQGNSVAGATVTFTLPSSGASGTFAGSGLTFTTTSNSQGLATTPVVTANSSIGAFSVSAVTGAFSATFSLVIGSPQGFSVSPSVLQFVWEQGTPLPVPQLGFVTSPNNGFSFFVDVPWAKVVNAPHGSINDNISVSVDPTTMPPGHYSGNVIIGDGAAILRLDLKVLPKPQINPSAARLDFRYTIGDGIPSEQLDYITAMTRNFNVTVTTVYVTQTSVQWLKLVGDGTSTTPAVLHVSIVPAGLNPGVYTANIHIVAPDATNSPYDIPVTLAVVATPVNPTPPEILAMVNSASSKAGPMSANEVVSLFGNNLSCVEGPQILVNGSAARIILGTYNQVNFLPPYVPAAGKVSVQFQCNGLASNQVTVELAARVPGIYARDGGSLADGPVAPGSALVFYGTGFNGDIQPVVTIGGIQAEILFAGAAPELPGITQINVRIPADAPAGAVLPVVVTQDGVPAQNGLTVVTATL